MHVHLGVAEFTSMALFIIIFGFIWRSVSARYADTSWGKAMAYIY